MTPQLVPQPEAGQGEAHLSGEQFGELLSRFTDAVEGEPTSAEVHLTGVRGVLHGAGKPARGDHAIP